MNAYGFAGRILHVDLTDGVVEKIPMDMTLAEQFGGGIGLCIKLAYDRIPFKCDPLSPENIIVIGAGPTVGTSLPASSRVYGVTKFPGSGRIGWCGGGGLMFGCMLKNAGYDHIVIKGRSKSLVYLKIVDDDVEICNASHLLGMGVAETYEVLQEDIGLRAGIISIGAAGENRVSFSMAFIDRLGTLGRGGFGAVMGDKNLKAIVVRGTHGIRVADQTMYMKLNNDLCNTIRGYPYLKEWQELGLIKSLAVVPREVYLEHKVRRIACVSCPIGDKDLMKLQDNGAETYICSSSAANLFMPLMYGFHDHYNAMKCIAMLDEYGMDMFEFFGLMSFAKTLYDKGIILLDKDQELFDTTSLSSMTYWTKKIAHREGLGDIFADGFSGLFNLVGEDLRQIAPYTTKGMLTYVGPSGPLPWNLFGTMELGQLLDPRGPHVGASGSPTYFGKRELSVFPKHMKRMGIPEEAYKRILPGLGTPDEDLCVGRLLRYSHQWFTILGTLGLCARAQINRFYNAELCASLYEAVTGIPTDLPTLRLRADRAWTLLHMANIKSGYMRKDNIIPVKWFDELGFRHYLTGKPITLWDIECMIDDYYDEQGWDRATGVPTEWRLDELGLLSYA